jgi:hypothetical protein
MRCESVTNDISKPANCFTIAHGQGVMEGMKRSRGTVREVLETLLKLDLQNISVATPLTIRLPRRRLVRAVPAQRAR